VGVTKKWTEDEWGDEMLPGLGKICMIEAVLTDLATRT
jgi:hypothetical protein